eukprot:4360553-Pleurochrysis_carterae.AAC.2
MQRCAPVSQGGHELPRAHRRMSQSYTRSNELTRARRAANLDELLRLLRLRLGALFAHAACRL